MKAFHAQLGERVRTQDALRVASSFFSDGLEKFKAGELELALSLFEQTLAVNQKYLQPEASSTASCFQRIAAVHDKLGNLDEAVTYYHRARLSLSSLTVPKDERGMLSRRKRRELLRQVQQQLEAMPRTHEPKVGEGVRLSEVQSLLVKLWGATSAPNTATARPATTPRGQCTVASSHRPPCLAPQTRRRRSCARAGCTRRSSPSNRCSTSTSASPAAASTASWPSPRPSPAWASCTQGCRT